MELMKTGVGLPAIKRIANALYAVLPNFNNDEFIKACTNDLDELELKQRVNHIIAVLHQFLPENFNDAADLLIALKPHWNYGEKEDSLSSFAAWPLVDYIAKYGLDAPEKSLQALKVLTSLFSAEFAIRPFIIKYPDYCHAEFEQWITDESDDVRRLVSEGTRPRLPWGMQLKAFIKQPEINLALLTHLQKDNSLYVRRSVANHLNDIAKDHPELVVSTCKTWQKSAKKLSKTIATNTQWVIKHATRTLIKNGHSGALSLLGFTENPQLSLNNLVLGDDQIKPGEVLTFTFDLTSNGNSEQTLVIDFALHLMKANGSQNRKVFKLKSLTLSPNELITLTKTFSFKPISTRKYYPGEQVLEILVNGKNLTMQPFILL